MKKSNEQFNNEPSVVQEETTKVHDYCGNNNIEPFKILQKDNKYFVILGNKIVSEKEFTELHTAVDYIESKPYELIIALIGITFEMMEQYKQEQEQLKQFKNEKK